MNETITLCLEIIFWLALFIVFYTYLGYGIVLYVLVKLKELFVKPVKRSLPASDAGLPEVTLFITALINYLEKSRIPNGVITSVFYIK
jgi:hypothetical protein